MRWKTAFLTLALALSACSGAADSSSPLSGGLDGDEGGASPTAPSSGEARDVLAAETALRRVIHKARLQLHASDTRETLDRIITFTESVGGFVAHAEVRPVSREGAQPEVSVTLRVPADQLTPALRTIKDFADDVVSESQSAQDVSDQFVDLEARLVNLEALETELRALLEEVRGQEGADPEKLLRVFNELASVRGQIEQIRGQIEYLANLTDLATVEVGLTPTPAAVPIVGEPWAPGEAARDAARSLVVALQGVADGLIRFTIYVLPVLALTVVPPAFVGWLAYRRWWANRPGAAQPEPATPAT